MKLFHRWFALRGSAKTQANRSRIRSSRWQRRRFTFECLEERKVLDADSFGLVGATDYFANPNFAQFDGSGPDPNAPYSIAILGSGAQLDHPVFGDDLVAPFGIGDRIVYQENFLDPTQPASGKL
jgi:hypothetical protein